MTSEKILGLQEVKQREYNDEEIKSIKLELARYAGSKNENISENTVNCWLMDFQDLQLEVFEAIKRIRLAKSIKNPKATTDFSVFMNVDLSEYSTFYKHEKKELPEPVIVNYGYAIPLRNDYQHLQKERYEIIDEQPPDKDCEYGYILIRMDNNYMSFFGKDNFRLIQ